MNNKLFYEIENEYLELRDNLINRFINRYNDSSDHITLKEFLDLGFNNCYIWLNTCKNDIAILCRYNLGYKDLDNSYYSEDFSLNEKQLNCKIGNITDYDKDSDGYTIVYINLNNKEDIVKFIDKDGNCI